VEIRGRGREVFAREFADAALKSSASGPSSRDLAIASCEGETVERRRADFGRGVGVEGGVLVKAGLVAERVERGK